MTINRIMIDRSIPAIKARAAYKKDNKKGYIVPPKADPEARKNEPPESQKAGPSGQGIKKILKRKSDPTLLVAVNITDSSSDSSSEGEESTKAPPKKPPPAKKGKGKAPPAGRPTK